ncbi:MAG: alpha-L-fucosidase, partial [Planctomycetota bacterium]
MLRTCAAGGGNLLLNIGPKADGSIPRDALGRLKKVGLWLEKFGDVIYGDVDRVEDMEWMPTGTWTRKGQTLYYWCTRWPRKELAIGGLKGELASARILPEGGPLPFEQSSDRLVIKKLPGDCPDRFAKVVVLELKFKTVPKQVLGAGCVVLE